MKFDLVTLYPMHRRCITLISSLLNPSGWVRKPLNYLKVRTGMYRYILLRTNMEFLYCPVPSRTGTYWYVPVRTILPNPVQGYRIPDDRNWKNGIDMYLTCTYMLRNVKHVHTWYVHVYTMYVQIGRCTYMSIHLCKFLYVSCT